MFKYNYDGIPSISKKSEVETSVINQISAAESLIDANAYSMEVIDTKAILSATLTDIDIMIKGVEAAEDKGPWYKRLWEAIKTAFKTLWGYISSFWKWIWGKFKAGKDKIKNGVISFCVKRVWLMKALKWLKDKFPGKKAKETTEDEVDKALDATEAEIQEELKKARMNEFSGFESIIGTEGVWDSIKGFFSSIKKWIKDKIMWFVRNCLVSEEMQEMMEKGIKRTTEESKNTVTTICYINKEKLPIFKDRLSELKDWLVNVSSNSEKVGVKYMNLLGSMTAIYILFLRGDTLGKVATKESFTSEEVHKFLNLCQTALEEELEGNTNIAKSAIDNPNVFTLEAYFKEFKFDDLFPTLEAVSEISEVISNNTKNSDIMKEINSYTEDNIEAKLASFCEDIELAARLGLLSGVMNLNNTASKRLAKIVTEITNKMNNIVSNSASE